MEKITPLEQLEQEIKDKGIDVIEYPFTSDRLKGICLYQADKGKKYIGINKSIKTSKEKRCILSEELTHHEYSIGDITTDTKAENFARRKSREKLISLDSLISAYEKEPANFYELADNLENLVKEHFDGFTITRVPLSINVCAHCGPGTVGLGFCKKI